MLFLSYIQTEPTHIVVAVFDLLSKRHHVAHKELYLFYAFHLSSYSLQIKGWSIIVIKPHFYLLFILMLLLFAILLWDHRWELLDKKDAEENNVYKIEKNAKAS